MMKHIKLLAIAFVSMLALASCNTDQEGPIYTPMGENVSLSQEQQVYMTEESTIDIPVRFVRSDAKSEYTAHYTLDTKTAENFSDPNNGQVTFKAGEGVAVVTLKAQNMQKGSSYIATLKLSDEDAAQVDTITKTAILSSTIAVQCDYEWEDAGTAEFTDETFSENPATAKVKVLHAVTDEFNLYKLVAPYTAVYGPADKDGVDEADIKFYLDENYNAKDLENVGVLDLFPGTGYKMFWDTEDYADYNYFKNNGNEFVVSFLLTDGDSLYPGGLFSFKWDKWPGNK